MAPPGPDPEAHGPVVSVLRLFGAQLAAVIGIAALITVVVAVLDPSDGGRLSAGTRTPAASASPAPERSATGTPAAPSPSGSATSRSATSGPAAPAPGTGATSAPPGVPAPVKVDVLNQSAGNGAGGRVAKRLRTAGWTVGRIADFTGNVSTTTVYWLDRPQRRQARQVARFLGGVRVQEGFSTLKAGRVSVVLVEPRY